VIANAVNRSAVIVLALLFQEVGGPFPEGRWENPGRSVIIAIAPCGNEHCGIVEWASEKAEADARRGGTDPLVGAQLLSGLHSRSPGRWTGKLFIPDLNKRSKADLRWLGPDRLKVTGCAVGGILCKSQLWTRVESEEPAQNSSP
jgi:uncharacterized protein (DUF2147 family)